MKIQETLLFHKCWEELQKDMTAILDASQNDREGVDSFIYKCNTAIDSIEHLRDYIQGKRDSGELYTE